MLAACALALVAAASERAPPAPRFVALGPTGMEELGYGATLRVRLRLVGVEASAGVAPQLLLKGLGCSATGLAFTRRLTASALGFFGGGGSIEHGARLGLVDDGRHGRGGIAGYQGEVAVSERLSFSFGFGARIFPDGPAHEAAFRDDRCGGEVVGRLGEALSVVEPYTGASLLLYVF